MDKMPRLITLSILLIAIFYNTALFGEEEMRLSLSDCLDIGLANNLDIKIAKIESKIKKFDIPIAISVFDTILEGEISYTDDERAASSTFAGTENLTANYEISATKKMPTGTELTVDYSNTRNWTDSIYVTDNPLHTAELSLTLEQPVLKNIFGYIDRGDVKLSKIEAEQAGLKALSRIEDSVADIEKSYWNLVFTYQNVALRERLLKQARRLYGIFKEHLKTGFVEINELYETEANVRIRKTELAIAENNLKDASNRLKLLLNIEGAALILPKNKLAHLEKKADFGQSLNDAFIANRDYRVEKKALASKKIKLKMKRNSLWPEVDLVGTFALNGIDRKFEKAQRRLTTDKHTYYYAGVEFSIPFENREARGEYNKAKLEKEKAILKLLQVEKNVINDIDEKVRKVNLNLENAKRWAKIREIQALKFEEEEKKLKYGRSNSKTLIDYQNDLTLATINEYDALLQYYSSLIDLENAKDMLLEKAGVLL
ncbi:MAG: TolC family protein [Candidatus Omnitrophota bacterium]|nr:MAG: TolC family protein [Candidatus Omnitrophota bacterium]